MDLLCHNFQTVSHRQLYDSHWSAWVSLENLRDIEFLSIHRFSPQTWNLLALVLLGLGYQPCKNLNENIRLIFKKVILKPLSCWGNLVKFFSHLKLCLATRTHNFKWLKISYLYLFNLTTNLCKSWWTFRHTFILNNSDLVNSQNRLKITCGSRDLGRLTIRVNPLTACVAYIRVFIFYYY